MGNKSRHKDFTNELTFGEKALYYFLYSVVFLISLLPFPVLYAVSDVLYLLIYRVAGYRKKLVRNNMRDSFPQKSSAELLNIERRFYHFFCDYILETIKLASISTDEMKRRVKFNGVQHILDSISQGHDVALYIGHYCNWEWMTSIRLHLPPEVMGAQVYHILNNKAFNALLLYIRSRMMTESISMQVILRRIIEVRREHQPQVIGFISDQVPLYPATRYWTDFLNHKDTIVITGTEVIAKKFGFSCVYFDISRPRRGYYDIDIVPMVENSKDIPDWDITEQYFRLFEQTICRAPEYWLWTHNRWKRTLEGMAEWQKHLIQKKQDSPEQKSDIQQ